MFCRQLPIVILLLILSPVVAMAQIPESECGFVDMSEQLGPVRDQKDVGWCFANTGADLLKNAYAQELGHAQASSTFVALNYFFTEVFKKEKKMDSVFGSGGNVSTSIQLIADSPAQRICLQSIDDKMIEGGSDLSLSQKLDFYRDLYRRYKEFEKASSASEKKRLGDELLDLRQHLMRTGSFLTLFNEQKVIETLKAPTLDEAVMQLVEVVCAENSVAIQGRAIFQNFYVGGKDGEIYDSLKQDWAPSRFSLVGEINRVLSQSKVIGITYNVENVLADKSSRGPHASVVVGRKFDQQTKQCYFKIRNSWSSNCFTGYTFGNSQNENYVEDPNSPPVYERSIKCENGNFWLSEKQMKDFVYDITYLAKKIK